MKKSSTISPFLILLVPALLVIGFKTTASAAIEADKQQAAASFQIPSLTGMIKSCVKFSPADVAGGLLRP